VVAHLLVDRDHAGWVRGHLGADAAVSERDDGSVVFRAEVTNWPAFRSFVLTFLEHAEILSPPELRQQMIDFLERP
jgi:predicted DNA-binding transcriptional regulator YafY